MDKETKRALADRDYWLSVGAIIGDNCKLSGYNDQDSAQFQIHEKGRYIRQIEITALIAEKLIELSRENAALRAEKRAMVDYQIEAGLKA